MVRFRLFTGLIAFAAIALSPASSHAFFHLWRFTEFFSNADGSVQFIELASLGSGEVFAQGATITSTSTGKVFTFPSNLSGSTSNKRLLIATSGFGALPGAVTPDFTLPSANFLDSVGDTLSLFAGFTIDSKTFTSLPTDGLTSRHYVAPTGATSLATNNPTNFTGAVGSVNLPPPTTPTGDYNGNGTVDAADYVVWRKTLNQAASPAGSGADGNASGMIDTGDYDFWRARFGNLVPAAGAAAGSIQVPEPAAAALIGVALCLVSLRRRP